MNAGVRYYRLKQTDYDGRFSYSEVRTVEGIEGRGLVVQLYPNSTVFGKLLNSIYNVNIDYNNYMLYKLKPNIYSTFS